MVSTPPRSNVSAWDSCSDTFVVRSTIASVLVEPDGAETVSRWIVRLVEGVVASRVTTLVFAFVTRMNVKVASGGRLLDQFVAVCHRPLSVLVQRSVPAASAPLPPNANEVEIN